MKRIRANNLEFAYLEEGEGPLVLLLHGFPDTAHTWGHQMPALAAAGHHAVAPYLRGYPPTEIPRDGFFRQRHAGQRHRRADSGAGRPWVGASRRPGLGRGYRLWRPRSVSRADPSRGRDGGSTSGAECRKRVRSEACSPLFHWWFFQLPDLPEKALAANDFAFVDYLWEHWTSAGYRDPAHIAQIKLMLKEPGALAATLGYYRAMFDARKIDPNLDSLRRSMERPIAVPTLALCGEEDLRAELMSDRRNILPANIACQNQLGDYVNQGLRTRRWVQLIPAILCYLFDANAIMRKWFP